MRRHFGAERDGLGPQWAALDEFTLAPGVGQPRADLFLVRAWRSGPRGHERILVEVKVSRTDLRHELARPWKLATFAAHAHRVYFATPAGLVTEADDLGEGVGLLEVSRGGRVRVARRATPRADPQPLPPDALVQVFRRAARAEARVRDAGRDGEDLPAQIAQLRADLAKAARAEATARRSAQTLRDRLERWQYRLAAAGGVPCRCGAPLKAAGTGAGREHHDKSPCPNGWPEVDLARLAERLGLGEGR